MRHYLIYFIALALLCGCSTIKEEDVADGVELSLNVSIEDLSSKATYVHDGTSLKCTWAAGDSISVVSLHNGAVVTVDVFTAEAGGRTATFSGRFTGNRADEVIAIFPVLKKGLGGYYSRTLPGNTAGMFSLKKGDSSLSFSPDRAYVLSQSSNNNTAHIAFSDIMTGTVDINTEGGGVTLRKHSALLRVSVQIPSLPSSEKVQSLTLKLSGGTPFTDHSATLPLTSPAGVWTTSSPCDSVIIGFGNVTMGSFPGFSIASKTLTAYIPVLPNATTPSLQGDAQRKLTATVKTDWSIYSAEKTIPAKSGSDADYALQSGTLNKISATLVRTGDIDPELADWVNSVNSLSDVDAKANALKEEILNTPSEYSITGTTYYVSNAGSDYNSGTSPGSPFKTLSKVNSLSLNKGDGVLFRRGDLWRGNVTVKDGVTYSAYGSGDKPRIYGSPYDAAKEGYWSTTTVSNVYKYSKTISQDAGTLIFNDGDAGCAYKVVPRKDYYGDTFHPVTMQPFSSWKDLNRDLDMYHDLSTGSIYLYSSAGNPATRWNSIEIPVKGNLFNMYYTGAYSAVIDNICIKYTGSHGVGAGSVKSLVVTNCEIGWIGGSLQNNNHETAPTTPGQLSRIVRYGNGVEIWGTCEEFRVSHNYIYQVYDAAITHQYSEKDKAGLYMDNISYTDNLVERSVYAIEYWLSVSDEYLELSGMRNYLIKGNIMRMSGGEWSWGFQRFNQDSPAAIKTWNTNKNRAVNFKMEGNIIDRGYPTLLNIRAGKSEWLPQCRGNVYFQTRGVDVGDMIEQNPKLIYVQ